MAQPLVDLTDEQLDALIAQRQAAVQQGPTPAEDIKKATIPALEKGGVALMTLPHTMANMAASGVNSLGENFADWPQSLPGRATQAVQDFTGRNSYPTVINDIEKESGPFYQAQTPPGKMWEGALSTAPMAALGGPEAIVPNVVRAMLSGGASEAAGQATAGTGYETPARVAAGMGAYAAPGAGWRPAINPNTPRAAMASTLENAGVPVSAADISGSRLTSSLEGRPPSGQEGGLSSSMLRMGGIERVPGDVRPLSQLVTERSGNLSQAVQGLENNTTLNVTPGLRKNLRDEVFNQTGIRARSPEENQAVVDAIKEFNARTATNTLPGAQYNDLRERWSNSGIPVLRNMAGHLDTAMDASTAGGPLAGAWGTWRKNWADLQGIKAASTAAGGEGTLQPLSPDAVVSSMHKRTPMRDVAEAGQGILGTRPPPYNVEAGPLAAASSLLGLGAGHAVGGTEAGVEGFLGAGAVPLAGKMLASPIQAAFRSRPGQNFLRNMDPKMVAALLANQGIQAKGAPQTPQAPTQ